MNRIGWCDMTWNPVIGCKNNCSYCYAKNLNRRFKFIENWNNPEWKEESYNKKLPQKSQKIFVGSMSEIYFWDYQWIEDVLYKTDCNPQHTFQFLTKFPEIYNHFKFPENCWLGVTITKNKDIKKSNIENIFRKNPGIKYNNQAFISFEPLLERIDMRNYDIQNLNWVIIGAETGNRKGKVIPKKEWIADIVDYCKKYHIPVYLKNSLKDIYPKIKKDFPM